MTSLSASFLPSVKFRSRSRSMSWWSASYPYYRDTPMLAYVFFLHHQQIGLQVLLPPSHPAAAVPAVARPCVTTSGGTVGARTHTQRERDAHWHARQIFVKSVTPAVFCPRRRPWIRNLPSVSA